MGTYIPAPQGAASPGVAPDGLKGQVLAKASDLDQDTEWVDAASGPPGPAGSAATVAVGTVTTGAAGSSATVSNAGTSSAAVFNFTIPRGDTGATGATGAAGATGPAGVVAAIAPLAYNAGTQTVALSIGSGLSIVGGALTATGAPGGSSGQVQFNNNGAFGGVSTLSFDGTILTLSGRLLNSYSSAASAPTKLFSGTWFTGGTSTTTKPHVLIEPTGTTSTAWNTSGTGLGVNAASGFTGNLLDLQLNGASQFSFGANSVFTLGGVANTGARIASSAQFRTGSIWIGYDGAGGSALAPADSSGAAVYGAWGANGLAVSSTRYLGFAATAASSGDCIAFRDAANIWGFRNGTNAQTLRIYNTFTSSTNYERARLEWASNVLRIGTEKGSGGGTARALELQTDGTTRLTIGATDGTVTVAGDSITVATSRTPASATATGTTGQIVWDSNYVYVCVATNTWKRSAISTW